MDVNRLELLRELADRGSITAVAKATNRTASAVSQQLKVLEREAGVALTEPHGRGIKLTNAGQVLAQTAADVAVALERADAVWEDFKHAPRGTVTLNIFASGGEMLLPGLLADLASVPGLDLRCDDAAPVSIDFSDQVVDYDLVVADSSGIMPAWRERDFTIIPLFTEPLDVALPEGHPLAEKRSLSPRDVASETWIGVPADYPFDAILVDVSAQLGHPLRITQRFRDNGIVESLVAGGHGLAILPRYTTRDHENGIVTRPLTGIRSERMVSIILRRDRAERPSVRRVIDGLRRQAARVEALHRG
jgi:DNA-binding transcriptional LysR family regulator